MHACASVCMSACVVAAVLPASAAGASSGCHVDRARTSCAARWRMVGCQSYLLRNARITHMHAMPTRECMHAHTATDAELCAAWQHRRRREKGVTVNTGQGARHRRRQPQRTTAASCSTAAAALAPKGGPPNRSHRALRSSTVQYPPDPSRSMVIEVHKANCEGQLTAASGFCWAEPAASHR